MKTRLTAITTLTLLALEFLACQQQPYPNLWMAQVRASVAYDSESHLFYYAYTLANGETNIGKIARFEIDISRDSHTLQIDTAGLQFENDGYTEKAFRRNYPHLMGRIVPVATLRTPPRLWSGGLTNALTSRFSTVAREDYVLPGDTLGGFEMVSKGLPGIRRCTVSPFFDVDSLFPDPTDTTITYYVPPVDSVRNAVKFHANTIGPTAPPSSFVATAFLDTLISYKHQAFALGWISDDGIVTSLDQKLEAARPQIIADRPSAKQILQAFVLELDGLITQSGKITSEAYALLKFNAEYLISKL